MKYTKRCAIIKVSPVQKQICADMHERLKYIYRKEMKKMTAIIGEFLVQLIKLIILMGVSVGAIFCGKKLRDRKDAKSE